MVEEQVEWNFKYDRKTLRGYERIIMGGNETFKEAAHILDYPEDNTEEVVASARDTFEAWCSEIDAIVELVVK